jgi:hypothetical protein
MVDWSPNERKLGKLYPPSWPTQTMMPFSTISPTSIFNWYVDPAGTTIDPVNNIYYTQVHDDPSSNFWWLSGIDLSTGTIISSNLLPNSHEFHQMQYNCRDSSIYAIMVKWAPNERHLVKINPTSGQITVLSPLSIFEWYIDAAGSAIDPENNMYYIQVRDDPQSNFWWLYGIDLTTGNVVYSHSLPNTVEFHQMEYNCSDSSLYSIMVTWSPNKRQLAKINPVNGQITILSQASIFEWYIGGGGTTIDAENNTFYVQTSDDPPNAPWYLYGIDLSTGNVLSSAQVPNNYGFHKMVFNQTCNTGLDFDYQNTCLGNVTEFNSTSCSGTLEWDFGDPNSGTNNYSSDAHPTHTFSDTGYYDVKLKLLSCCFADSIVKTIYVDSNNQVAILPNDSSICLNDTILLDVSYLIGTYTWQDSTSNPLFQVTDPGVYWVLETTCNTSDTIAITYDSFQNFSLGQDTSLCTGTITLDAGNSGGSYLWQDNSSSQQYLATAPGLYSVLVTDSLGCSESDTVEISIGSISIDLGNDTLICSGNSLILWVLKS